MNKTYSAKPAEVVRIWHLIDAKGVSLGRISAQAAQLLLGKGKASFTPHVDSGDFVVIINAGSIKITGNKTSGKTYYRHSGYPGGIKSESLSDKLQRDPTKIIEMAVRGMLPVNKLRSGRLARLKIYSDSEHPHSAQLGLSKQDSEKGT